MPIRAENKSLYPANWKQISARIRFDRAHNRCEVCGVANHSLIHPCDRSYPSGQELDMYHSLLRSSYNRLQAAKIMGLTMIILTVAHLDHDPSNNADGNLKAMCQKCHNGYDAAMRQRGIRERASVGQLRLGI